MADDINAHRGRLRCNFARIDEVFPGCLAEAQRLLSPAGVEAWLDGASAVCALGRGQELPLIFLEALPPAAARCGEALIAEAAAMARGLSASGAAQAIAPYLAGLPADAPELLAAQKEAHLRGPIAAILANMHPDGYWSEPGSGYYPKYFSPVW